MANGKFSKEEIGTLVDGFKKKLESMNVPISKMYLYGSYAKNNARADSDVDVCVISPMFLDRIDATMMLMKMRDDNELILSPIAFSPSTFVDENPLAWEIKSTGISLN